MSAPATHSMFSVRDAFGWIPDGSMLGNGSAQVMRVSTDTRDIRAGDLFVALKGERFDAHDFVAEAVAKGAVGVVAERWVDGLRVPMILVPDARAALGAIAAGWRRRLKLPIIAVTGSNGKTTVKEMIASILAEFFGRDAAFATRGNLNNDVGVPLSLLSMTRAHRAAVIEIGMNHVGEIEGLARIVAPQVALVNNAQREHQEFLDGPEATARENGAVFRALKPKGIAVFPGDDACSGIWEAMIAGRRPIRFGLRAPASAESAGVKSAGVNSAEYKSPEDLDVSAARDARPGGFDADIEGKRTNIRLNIAGRHNVRNALAAAACCSALKIPASKIAAGLANFHPVAGRLRRLDSSEGSFGSTSVIDDSYNANPDSVRAAIDVLADEPAPRLLVLGDMGEVGDQGPEFHREVGAYARARGIERVHAHGPLCAHAVEAFNADGANGGARHFETIDALIDAVRESLPDASSMLVKGSRFMRMERVIRAFTGAPLEAH